MSADSPTQRTWWRDLYYGTHRLKRAFRLAIKSLWLHRLRSLLTMLGIVFGVCSVIAMLAIGEGASSEAQDQIKILGSQNIILKSVKPPEDQKASSSRQNFVLDYGLTLLDLERIRASISDISSVVPARIIREYARNATRNLDCEIVATVPAYPEVRSEKVSHGRFFTEGEVESVASVCVLGEHLAEELFPARSPLGKDVRIGSSYYRVVGVMDSQENKTAGLKGDSSTSSISVGRIYIPISTARTRFGEVLVKRRAGSFEAEKVALHEVTIKVQFQENVAAISQSINDLLARSHKKKDYEIVVPLELLRRAERTKQIFNTVLGSIAAISLLVGGIGIMNIMLASVTERTREIGIRRALGARRRDIIIQFLVESVMLSGTGGILGVMLGVSIPFLVTHFAEMKTIITFWSPFTAFSISTIVGVVFGIYPAMRAADMDPVEALRHG